MTRSGLREKQAANHPAGVKNGAALELYGGGAALASRHGRDHRRQLPGRSGVAALALLPRDATSGMRERRQHRLPRRVIPPTRVLLRGPELSTSPRSHVASGGPELSTSPRSHVASGGPAVPCYSLSNSTSMRSHTRAKFTGHAFRKRKAAWGGSERERASGTRRERERERGSGSWREREREVPARGGDEAPAPKRLVTDACDCNEGGVDTWSTERKAWCCTQ
jgi:hypothetical protein